MGKIKRGVSLYSYQQSQFFKELDLEGQIREVGTNLFGADGIELLDEQGLRKYPNPPEEFFIQWYGWMEKYHTTPVTMDVFCDVLQFRDHVMSYHECAERLKSDIRLAKKLGFKNVRVLATTEIEILTEALPVAEECDIRIGKEIHGQHGSCAKSSGRHGKNAEYPVPEGVWHGENRLRCRLRCSGGGPGAYFSWKAVGNRHSDHCFSPICRPDGELAARRD